MRTDPIALAARAKGPLALARRVRSIASRYGLTPAKMDRALQLFARTLARFECGASFPITTVTLKRNSGVVTKYLGHNIEFAVHGYTHIDYSQLASEEQLVQLHLARQVFQDLGVSSVGFVSYLRRALTVPGDCCWVCLR
jgi:peptidoglycan/xylan/chitin deacetylase (PgdA/CDA1 family)